MMKMMILAPRRSDMSHQQFRRYVTEVHGPLVRSVPEVAVDIRHYHYNFPIIGAQDSAFGHPLASRFDIVTQAWFDSREAQLQNMAKPEYWERVRPDEGKFADEANAIMHYTVERGAIGGKTENCKVFYFRRRRVDLSREEFQSRWLQRMTDIFSAHSEFSSVVSRYVQNHVLSESEHPDGSREIFYDVIDEFCLPGASELARLAQMDGLVAQVRQAEHELLDGSRTLAFIGETVKNIP